MSESIDSSKHRQLVTESIPFPRDGGVGDLQVELAKQIIEPPGGDPRIEAFAKAMLDISYGRNTSDRRSKEITHGLDLILNVASQNATDAAYAVNKLLRVFQKQLLFRKPANARYNYPADFDSTDMWRRQISRLVSDQSYDEIIEDLLIRETQSNVVQRYSSLKLITQLYAERFDGPPRVLDIGCSQNLGLKKIALDNKFDPIRIVKPGESRYLPSTAATKVINTLLAKHVTLGPSEGIDLFDVQDRKNVEWVRSCSFYPSELLDKHLLAEFNDLRHEEVENVGFVQGDISDYPLKKSSKSDQNSRINLNGPYDIVFASTSMYQMWARDRHKTYRVASHLLKPNGLMVVQDFVDSVDDELVFSGPGGARFEYRTFVKDKQQDFSKPQELLRWDNGRCQKAMVGAGKLSLLGAEVSVVDILQEISLVGLEAGRR